MKVTYTQILARKILLAFLAFIIIISIAAFFVHNSITEKLEHISRLANNAESDQSKPEQALLLLHESENDFQESLSSVNSQKRVEYKIKLSQAFEKIDTLLKENADTTHLNLTQSHTVKLWYQKKLKLSDKLYILKHTFDSLLTVYADFNQTAGEKAGEVITGTHINKKHLKTSTDTTLAINNKKKKGLLGRIKDAIVNKTSGAASVNVKHNSSSDDVSDLATQKVLTRDKNNYSRKLKELQLRNVNLLNKQKELIMLNTRISNELERIINDVKEINYTMTDELKKTALINYRETTLLLNKFYMVALFLVLAFAILLIVFIIQLNKSEQLLIKESERSVAMAQQKMDLLLHMSHEIRNPLMAIMGFLYIFSKSSLLPEQAEMLGSIRLSSDMLLRTLNDTLDAAKMESNEFKINTDPFNPDLIIKTVMESMEFSAAKKGLTMDYHFKGNKEAIISGDSFRLKQVMINLLSNAIKYTDKGGITVTADLNADNSLQIAIGDTGKGISLEQQAKLFSKYYQTNSSKGSIGTGLGLFICKQLVEMQGGKINVKSTAGAGATFSFFIPYKKAGGHVNVEQGNNDPLLLLNGISILAVDDNELGLMFLKMVMSKWHVQFHHASNGKEALDMLAKNKITIVLTDIQMPEMDGYELLIAIRKLDGPAGKLPVIVISGTSGPEEAEKMLKIGFSGSVSKPIVKTELAEELVKVLLKTTLNGATQTKT